MCLAHCFRGQSEERGVAKSLAPPRELNSFVWQARACLSGCRLESPQLEADLEGSWFRAP